ncbi:alpha/beta hydrolase [Limosilactobacillus difficilis]|uniref:alpha/beta hydrolase n=1 Tax=Limosilactobacillus difficilis TaxID=2991838 RepID=UPI0038CC0524
MTVKLSKKYWLIVIFFAILTLILAIFGACRARRNVQLMETRQQSRMSPVIMIPGSSASVNRFDRLVAKINRQDHRNHSLIKVKVYNSGKIVFTGQMRPNDREPFIVVGFQNNHDGYSNIKKQAAMFNRAFNRIKQRYSFNNFKGIGHSNGGLIYTYFLEHYFNERQIRLTKLMTIGSPYNFSEPTSRKTQMLSDFEKYRSRIPESLIVYSVAGSENYVEDGIVQLSSVLAGKYIYQKQVKHYTQITVTGKLSEHSDLPQNRQVLDLIERYILNQLAQDDPTGNQPQQPANNNN